ncbi:MAG: hypothetical protein AMXMBFR20_26760 [Planctomycetia bacterium]
MCEMRGALHQEAAGHPVGEGDAVPVVEFDPAMGLIDATGLAECADDGDKSAGGERRGRVGHDEFNTGKT